jgi:SulP family sulfate permease
VRVAVEETRKGRERPSVKNLRFGTVREKFVPKLLTILREGYSREQFVADAGAGLIVGIVALPLAIAFAIASGVKPEQGLYTAIIAGFVVSAFGGSRVQIAGPTGAFIIIVYRIVQTYGYEGLAVATLLAGGILIVMGLARFGSLLRFVPYPLTIGFTSGIAVVIFSSQINDFLGLRINDLPADFVDKWQTYVTHVGSLDWYTLGVGVVSLIIMVS